MGMGQGHEVAQFALTAVDLGAVDVVIALVVRDSGDEVTEQKSYHHVDAAHERRAEHLEENLFKKVTLCTR